MLPAKSFYLIRHGESVANVTHITAGGQMDSPLTETGREQARALKPFLPHLDIQPEVLYHSDMQRARDTALILNESLDLEAQEMHNLREHDMGEWDGQPWHLILPKLENGETPAGGEGESAFAQRIQSTLTTILEKGKLPIIVAHGGLFHAMGFLYEYGMSNVQNCHLHYFEPFPAYTRFPWRVWQFDIEGGELKKSPAPFCLSQALDQIF